jgi:hypothetical protein
MKEAHHHEGLMHVSASVSRNPRSMSRFAENMLPNFKGQVKSVVDHKSYLLLLARSRSVSAGERQSRQEWERTSTSLAISCRQI